MWKFVPLVFLLKCALCDPLPDADLSADTSVCGDVEEIPPPNLHISFNENSALPHKLTAKPYDLAFKGDDKGKNFETGIFGEGLMFNGLFYLQAKEGVVSSNCLADVDLCVEGFSLTVWLKPANPWKGDENSMETLFQFGSGNDAPFGLVANLRRNKLMVTAYGRQATQAVSCRLPSDGNPNAWFLLSVRRRGVDQTKGALSVHINGKGIQCDDTSGKTATLATDTNAEIFIGGGKVDGAVTNLYNGAMDDLNLYSDWIPMSQIRTLWKSGKASVVQRDLKRRNLLDKLVEELKNLL